MAVEQFGIVRNTKDNLGNIVRLLHEARQAKKVIFEHNEDTGEWLVSFDTE